MILLRPARHLLPILGVALIIVVAGCTHYQLGRGQMVPRFADIYVPPPINRSTAVEVQTVLWQQLVDAINTQPGMRSVGTPEDADATLTITLVDFQRAPGSFAPDDTGRPASMDVTLIAKAQLSGQSVDDSGGRKFRATETVFASGGYPNAERQAMPALTRRLAADIVNGMLATW